MPYYDDDGNELDPASVPVPHMCSLCDKRDVPEEEVLCNLNRFGQAAGREFRCEAFVSIYGALIDDIIV
jgi:hypothetical protein